MVAVPPMGNRDFQMRNLTIIAFLMATTSLASAASNESFIGQIGDTNNALVGQNSGNNKQGTDPGRQAEQRGHLAERSGFGPTNLNKSGTGQFGDYNDSLAVQDGGNNTQGTLQIGVENKAVTTQSGATGARPTTPAPLQFGYQNNSTVEPARRQQRCEHDPGRRQEHLGHGSADQRGPTRARTTRPPRSSAGTTLRRPRKPRRVHPTAAPGSSAAAGGVNNSASCRPATSNSALRRQNSVGTGQNGSNGNAGSCKGRRRQQLGCRSVRRQERCHRHAGRRSRRCNDQRARTVRSSASSAGEQGHGRQLNGNNTQGTLQFGARNIATTGQLTNDTGGTQRRLHAAGRRSATSRTTSQTTQGRTVRVCALSAARRRQQQRGDHQFGDGNKSTTSSGRKRHSQPATLRRAAAIAGVDNNALTLQVGKDNIASTAQAGGSVSLLPSSNNFGHRSVRR